MGFRTDPTGKFLDYGAKTFVVAKARQKTTVLKQALAWAMEQYGVTTWVCDPFGGWQDAAVAKRVVEMIDSGGTIESAESEGQ